MWGINWRGAAIYPPHISSSTRNPNEPLSLWDVDALPGVDQVWIADLRVGLDQQAERGVELAGNRAHRVTAHGDVNDLAVRQRKRGSRKIDDLASRDHILIGDFRIGAQQGVHCALETRGNAE